MIINSGKIIVRIIKLAVGYSYNASEKKCASEQKVIINS